MTAKKPRLMLVEDNPGDVRLFRWALEHAKISCELMVLEDGGAALALVDRENQAPAPSVPDLVVLDLNLPKASGKEVLAAMRDTAAFSQVPVVIWTSSKAMSDKAQLDALRVKRYLLKPAELNEFMTLGALIGDLLKPV